MRSLKQVCVAVACILGLPGLALAQASITGVVRDTSGAVLPGVTVEAASEALIEKVRSAVTDGTGQYRIIDLRPGSYSITFNLAGFSTVRRDGIELTGSLTATINADLRVGAVEETITVVSETPVVDVQSVRRQATIAGDTLNSIPAARAYGAVMVLIPAIITQAGNTADVQVTPNMTVFGGSGGRGNEGRIQVDGLNTGAALNGAGVSTYIPDVGTAREVAFTTSGGLGEAEVGGPTISVVPRTGGNSLRGQFFFAGVNDAMVGSNYTQSLKDRGLGVPGQLLKLWDVNVGVGGPIRKDRLWYFATLRDQGSYRSIPGIYPNLNAGDPTRWTYAADTSRQAQGAESWTIATARITYQATPRHKFTVYWDEQNPCNGATYSQREDGCRHQPSSGAVVGALGLGGLTATTSPEIAGYLDSIQRAQQVSWTSPLTNRLLLDAGMGTFLARWGPMDMPGNPTRDLIRVNEQCAGGCPANGGIPGLNYRSANWGNHWNGSHTWKASASYITGAHSLKFGYQGGFLVHDTTNFTNNQNLTFRVNNGVPNQLTQTLLPFSTYSRVRYSAFYAQDQWTLGRLTLQGALRFDHAWSYYPEQQLGPTRFFPVAAIYSRTDGVDYKDITPRVGVAYDVFGTGKTSLKVNVGQYLEPASNGNGNYGVNNPTSRLSTTSARTWTDANRDFVPDCNLLSQEANGECARGNLNFGQQVFANTYDPNLLHGWDVRPTDWGVGVSIQQEVLPRVSVEVGYNRRWLQHFNATDNRATVSADYAQFSITAPLDPRLPDGGGYLVTGLYDVNPNRFGQTDNYVTASSSFGKRYQRYNGILVNVSARPRNGLTFQGGVNAGSTVTDECEIRAQLPETNLTNPYCHNAPGMITRVTGLAAYTIPRVDVLVSTAFRSDQGAVLAANYVVSNAAIAPVLGRNLSAGANANVTVNLLEPGEKWGDRVNEVDIRVAKILRFGRTRTNVGIDVYNVLNSDAVLTFNQSFVAGGTWLRPNSVLTPRFVKFSAQVDF